VPDTQPPTMASAVYDTDDLAALLSCSTRHIARMRDAGKLPPPGRIGNLVRWSKVVIDDWLAAGCPAQDSGRRRKGKD
jgi:predicted DNA-binding transcriptional regulator AlpA